MIFFKIEQILKHPIILKKLEIIKSLEENEESSLLQTIRIPKNLHCLTNKLPQPNYEKRQKGKNSSFTDEVKESLPDIKKLQNNNVKYSGKKNEKENDLRKQLTEETKREDKIDYNLQNTEELNMKSNNDVNEIINNQKKKRRIEVNDRSLDNIRKNEIYASSNNNNNNIKILKSENYERSINKSIIREKSPIDDTPSLKKKREFMMLPNIKNQQNIDNR